MVPVPLAALSLLVDGPAAMARGLAHLGWDGVLSTAYTAGLCSLVEYAVLNHLAAAGEPQTQVTTRGGADAGGRPRRASAPWQVIIRPG